MLVVRETSVLTTFRSMMIHDSPTSTHISAHFELPGLQTTDIDVHVTLDGRLIVSGERRAPLEFTAPQASRERKSPQVLFPVSEFRFGRFERVVNVPPGIEVRDNATHRSKTTITLFISHDT